MSAALGKPVVALKRGQQRTAVGSYRTRVPRKERFCAKRANKAKDRSCPHPSTHKQLLVQSGKIMKICTCYYGSYYCNMTLKKHQEHRSAIEETFSQPEYSLAAQSDPSQSDRLYSRQKETPDPSHSCNDFPPSSFFTECNFVNPSCIVSPPFSK